MTTAAMTWTTDKPSTPGFYWYHAPGMRARVVEVVMEKYHGLCIVTTAMRLEDMPPEEYEWAGPIEEPPR